MKKELERILDEANNLKDSIKNLKELENFRIKFLGRKGMLKVYLDKIVELADEERKSFGKYINYVKSEIEKITEELESKLKNEKVTRFDFRHPGKKPLVGHFNLLSISIEKIKKIFLGLGFDVVESPEIVTEYECFDSLNIPQYHPARDLWDTLWINSKFPARLASQCEAGRQIPNSKQIRNSKFEIRNSQRYLFRAHTSAYQVKYIKNHKPPFRIVIPGKVFRQEATDKSHDFEFYQLEGLAISEDANLMELKGVFENFFAEFFGKKLEIRFRPGYFPFVEPGLEVDLECIFCNKKGCAICKGTGFIEVAGAGMVHPNVLEHGGLDPKENQGFAFGFGLDRMIMLKYKIDDIRLFHSGDLRFIKQF